MTNGDYIRSKILDRDIMIVAMDGIMTTFGIWDKAWTVFYYGWLKQRKVSRDEERKIWLCWLSQPYDENFWKKTLDTWG